MELVFATFETTNNMADLTNFWVVFDESSDSEYWVDISGNSVSTPRKSLMSESTSNTFLLPHYLKFRNFDYIPFCVYFRCVVMWQRSVTLLKSSDHTQIHASSQWDPTRLRSFRVSVTFPLKTKFEQPYLCCGYWSCLTLTAVWAFQ